MSAGYWKKKKKATCEKRLPWQPTSEMRLCSSKRAQVTHINFLQAQEKDVVGGVWAGVGPPKATGPRWHNSATFLEAFANPYHDIVLMNERKGETEGGKGERK